MAENTDSRAGAIQPLHAFLLASTVPLFLGALFSDMAYRSSYHVQWSNFAAWLLVGAMVFTGLSLLCSLVIVLRARPRARRPLAVLVLLLAAFVLGLIDCFVHARDAWAVMPDGLILTAIVSAIVIVATWIGFSSLCRGVA